MNKDKSKQPDRRDFLRFATAAAVQMATGGPKVAFDQVAQGVVQLTPLSALQRSTMLGDLDALMNAPANYRARSGYLFQQCQVDLCERFLETGDGDKNFLPYLRSQYHLIAAIFNRCEEEYKSMQAVQRAHLQPDSLVGSVLGHYKGLLEAEGYEAEQLAMDNLIYKYMDSERNKDGQSQFKVTESMKRRQKSVEDYARLSQDNVKILGKLGFSDQEADSLARNVKRLAVREAELIWDIERTSFTQFDGLTQSREEWMDYFIENLDVYVQEYEGFEKFLRITRREMDKKIEALKEKETNPEASRFLNPQLYVWPPQNDFY